MAIKITIPTPLRQFAGGNSEVEVNAATAGDAILELTTTYSDLRNHLYNEQGKLRNFINIYVGDEDIRHLDGPATPIKENETLTIVPSIAGGSSAATARADSSLPELSNAEVARYSRHLLLPEVGLEGQRKLKNARVLTIGTAALAAGLYLQPQALARSVVDFDVVDESNLHRQIIHKQRMPVKR